MKKPTAARRPVRRTPPRLGMTEAELLEIAGEPDLLLWDSRTVKTYSVTEAERLRR